MAAVALVVTLVIALFGATSATAQPVSRRDPSRIAWTRVAAGGIAAQIVSARPDGRDLRPLTEAEPDTFDLGPVISPDGTRIVFERNRGDAVELVVVAARGGRERRVDTGCVDPCAADVAPSWTAAGDRIVFTRVVGPFDQVNDSARSAVLHTAKPDGSDVRRLSEPGIDGVYEDYHAAFSADGRYLVFVRVRNADIRSAIFRMDADGSDVRQLTPWTLDADLPDLSLAATGPTRDLVVFETFGHGPPEGSAQDVATVPATCRSLADCTRRIRYVTRNGAGPAASFNPTWSPDGRRVAYVEFRPPAGPDAEASGDIWTVDPDGTDRRPVSTSPRFDFHPNWGPAGRR